LRGTIFALIVPFVGAYLGFIVSERPLTIEILALGSGGPSVIDRVTGGTIYFDEAKRIGERLLSRTEVEVGYGGYRILKLRSSSALHLAFRRSCTNTQLVLAAWSPCIINKAAGLLRPDSGVLSSGIAEQSGVLHTGGTNYAVALECAASQSY
jgi:hypothetical protein